jgi:hypothetical protein
MNRHRIDIARTAARLRGGAQDCTPVSPPRCRPGDPAYLKRAEDVVDQWLMASTFAGGPLTVGRFSFGCSVAFNPITASCSFTQVVASIPDAAITTPASVTASSTGNVAAVPDAGSGSTYTWSIANGSISAGGGTRQISFTAGASGAVPCAPTMLSWGCRAGFPAVST